MHIPLAVGAGLAFGAAGLGFGVSRMLSKKPDAKAIPKPLPMPVRNDAMEAADRGDMLRKRRGGAADIVSGAMGVEPVTPTGKQTLVS
jgi:hypothetical protein